MPPFREIPVQDSEQIHVISGLVSGGGDDVLRPVDQQDEQEHAQQYRDEPEFDPPPRIRFSAPFPENDEQRGERAAEERRERIAPEFHDVPDLKLSIRMKQRRGVNVTGSAVRKTDLRHPEVPCERMGPDQEKPGLTGRLEHGRLCRHGDDFARHLRRAENRCPGFERDRPRESGAGGQNGQKQQKKKSFHHRISFEMVLNAGFRASRNSRNRIDSTGRISAPAARIAASASSRFSARRLVTASAQTVT